MSLDATIARIDQIETLQSSLGPQAATPAAAAANTSTFAGTLGDATSAAAPAAAGLPSEAAQFQPAVQAAAGRYHLDPALIDAVIEQESGFNTSATSSAGAAGLMQLMPATARGLGVTNPYDPTQSIDAGARYLRGQLDRFGGDVRMALAAYNAGPGAVEQYGGVPPYPETQSYVTNVLANYDRYRSSE